MNNDHTSDLVITRIFDAPIARVWKAWTDQEEMKKWWGPKYFTSPFVNIDFRVGGKYLACMRGKPGPDMPEQDFWNTGTYKEIVPMKKIIATDSFSDAKGNIVPSTSIGMPELPMEMEVAFHFEDVGGKTKVTIWHSDMSEGEMKKNAMQGWNETLDKLEKILQ